MTGFLPIALVILALLAAAAAPRSLTVSSPKGWTRPFPPMPGHPRITSPYGWRTDPITGKRGFHKGLDLAAPTGTAMFAPYDGIVYRVDRDGVGRGVFSGNAVVVETGGWRWTFMHLSSAVVHAGDPVIRGKVLGFTGATGRATGPHLHIQIADRNGNSVDPATIYALETFETKRKAA